jgi:D-tyrosyl-tRNA(Tyr) deacylase
VRSAQIHVDGALIGQCQAGFLVLVSAIQGDTNDMPAKLATNKLATKISKLRIFKDDTGRMNRSLVNVGGAALIASNFTLANNLSRGSWPVFSAAAAPKEGE